MRGTVAAVLGIALAINGVVMLGAPHPWYALVPGVSASGPFNPHFVRDVGVAYAVAGMGLLRFAFATVARPAALAAAAFLALHAVVHLWDAAAGREPLHQLPGDLVTIFLPAALAIWVIWPRGRTRQTTETDNAQMVPAAAGGSVRKDVEL